MQASEKSEIQEQENQLSLSVQKKRKNSAVQEDVATKEFHLCLYLHSKRCYMLLYICQFSHL